MVQVITGKRLNDMLHNEAANETVRIPLSVSSIFHFISTRVCFNI